MDKSDPEFEAFLLEVLSDFQVTVPELGTIEALKQAPVFLTSNNAREMSDALKRRCLHLYIDYPSTRSSRTKILDEGAGRRSQGLIQDIGPDDAQAARARSQEGAVDQRDPRLGPRLLALNANELDESWCNRPST